MTMPDIPPWGWLVAGAALGFLAGFISSWAQRAAARLRADDDPGNDWQADLLESIADALNRGDAPRARALADELRARRSDAKK